MSDIKIKVLAKYFAGFKDSTFTGTHVAWIIRNFQVIRPAIEDEVKRREDELKASFKVVK